VHYILDEIVCGGLVLETSLASILEAVDAQNKIEQQQKGGILTNTNKY